MWTAGTPTLGVPTLVLAIESPVRGVPLIGRITITSITGRLTQLLGSGINARFSPGPGQIPNSAL
ncbi:hypothetical protein DPMN_074695 [Dreissena polymorpha]|uniref:Uncharacterized protein n=1 Tax=Dreissena polymorpha TaxID=45954 RepID=A0A9D3YFR6_DREPO|nr:hypothetical protein DPMN_074695 [Dreissena polymorpha]